MDNKPAIPALNFHLIKQCNMRCKFCFATFNDIPVSILQKGYLKKEETQSLLAQLKSYGFTKVNFAGGEPLIHPHITDHINYAKSIGFITSIVTNGSKLDETFLDHVSGNLDYVGISIDSLNEHTNLLSGRAHAGTLPISLENYVKICWAVKKHGIGLKVNTVVNALNKDENMSAFIDEVNPIRWKLFQMLPVAGQNDVYASKLAVNVGEYNRFVERHQQAGNPDIDIIPENNELMTGSYVMIDPCGRFFDNTQGRHTYSDPILEIGVEKATLQVNRSLGKYLQRKGDYFETQFA